MAQCRTQWRKAGPHRHKDQIVSSVIFDGEATTNYIFQYDLVVRSRFEERARSLRRLLVMFEQELEFILFRSGGEGDVRITAIVHFQDRDLTGFELRARIALRDHVKAPDRRCMFFDASNA